MNPLADLLLSTARLHPDRPLLSTPAGEIWAHGDLDRRSAALAHVLVSRGVQPSDRVVVQLGKSADVVALHVAVVRVGAVYVPLNMAYTDTELSGLLEDADPALVVRDARPDGSFAHASLEDLLQEGSWRPGHFADVARSESDPAAMLYTSGTTGRPKGAVMSQGNLVFQRDDTGLGVGFHGRRRTASHAAAVPHARTVRGRLLRARIGRVDGPSRRVLPGRRHPRPAWLHGDDGRADSLHEAPRPPRLHRGRHRRSAPVHVGIRADAHHDARAVRAAHRTGDPRALRDDGDVHADVQPAHGRAQARQRRPSAARGRRSPYGRHPWRDRGPRAERVQRILAPSGAHGHGVHRRRVVPDRRPRALRRRRLPRDRRPIQGPSDHRWAERVPEGGRVRTRQPPRSARVSCGGPARRGLSASPSPRQ